MNDIVLFGVVTVFLSSVFYASQLKAKWPKRFFAIFPPLFLCYFLPSLLHSPLHLVDLNQTNIPMIGTQICLPACLILFCLNLNFREIASLGPKAVIIFLVGSVGVILGGPFALFIMLKVCPQWLTMPLDDLWRGLSTIAGSWIGGSVNQTAMKEVYHAPNDVFAALLVVDVAVAALWMSVLVFAANKRQTIDKFLNSSNTKVEELIEKNHQKSLNKKTPNLLDFSLIFATAFGGVAVSHLLAKVVVNFFADQHQILASMGLDSLSSEFFWLVFFATSLGILLSQTRLKKLESVGAMELASLFLYFLVATIGLRMDISNIAAYWPLLILGLIWLTFHALLMMIAAKLMRAPFFFVAVGSMANIGGAASSPVIASAFHPSLAPVGVILAILGYALGNYGAMLCAWLMQWVIKIA